MQPNKRERIQSDRGVITTSKLLTKSENLEIYLKIIEQFFGLCTIESRSFFKISKYLCYLFNVSKFSYIKISYWLTKTYVLNLYKNPKTDK